MSDPVTPGLEYDQFRKTYFEECAEILIDLDERLVQLQSEAANAEALNAIFRAVHSIKAGAAAFSFTQLASFAHTFEALLDWLRDGRIQQDDRVSQVLVRAGDILAEFVEAAKEGRSTPQDFGENVAGELEQLLREAGHASAVGSKPQAKKPGGRGAGLGKKRSQKTPRKANAGKTFKIVFKPRAELFRHANEPLLLIRELKSLGDLTVACDVSAIPSLAAFDPEDSYLSWTFHLRTKAPKSAIAEVFEFVDEDCDLSIETVEAEQAEVSARAEEQGDSSEPIAAHEPDALKPKTPSMDKTDPVRENASRGASSIRVDLSRVDRLVNVVGELVITQAMFAEQIAGQAGQRLNWTQGQEDLAAHTRELQECVMAIRMQPVRSVFARMPRLVRDVSTKLNKKVRLITSGDQTEVDKTVVEELADPLTHMIRNAIDHGIEPPEARLASGKPEEGTIELSASQRAGNILIQITDDGAGIDRERLLRKAVEKGVVPPDAVLSEDETYNLIFTPGFSTAEKVTDTSGRGVGMDVVRRNISNLGGRIQIQSTLGKGTRFTLILPLTLAVLDGMLVAVGKEKYIVPLTSIVESIRPDQNQVRAMAGGAQVLSIRGEFIRLIPLHRIFQVPGAIVEPWRGLVVVVELENGSKIGVLVDELIGQQQVVVKSLEENFDPVPGISGATILGNGRVALILDVEALGALPEAAAQRDGGKADEPADERGEDALSFDIASLDLPSRTAARPETAPAPY